MFTHCVLLGLMGIAIHVAWFEERGPLAWVRDYLSNAFAMASEQARALWVAECAEALNYAVNCRTCMSYHVVLWPSLVLYLPYLLLTAPAATALIWPVCVLAAIAITFIVTRLIAQYL